MKTTLFRMTSKFTYTCLIACSVIVSGCGGPFGDYSNQELREEYRKCDYNKLSPAGAQRCNNLKKECEARKNDSGFRC